MNTHKTKVSALAMLTGALAALWLVLAAPAGAQPVAINGSVASGGNSFAADGSTASGDAVAIGGSTASGCSFAANVSTASGGVCPPKAAPVPKAEKKVVLEKVAVGEARAAVATPAKKLAFTGTNVGPLVSAAVVLLAAGAALLAAASPRRKVAPIS